jgi:hypothetical protein
MRQVRCEETRKKVQQLGWDMDSNIERKKLFHKPSTVIPCNKSSEEVESGDLLADNEAVCTS